MASSVQQKFKYDNSRQTLNLLTDEIRLMVLKTTYLAVHNVDRDFIDDGSANDPASHEIVATNYTGGFGGAGRHEPQNPTITRDDANDRVVYDFDDEPWVNVGGATNDTFGSLALFKLGASDAASPFIAHLDLATKPTTNGGTITVVPNAQGVLRF